MILYSIKKKKKRNEVTEETRAVPKRDGTTVKIEERDPVQFASDRRCAAQEPRKSSNDNKAGSARSLSLTPHIFTLFLSRARTLYYSLRVYSLLIWCDCLDSPILLTWTSRLKETVRSAGFQPETEAPVGSGGSKSAAGALEGSSSLKKSERCTSSIFPAFSSRS